MLANSTSQDFPFHTKYGLISPRKSDRKNSTPHHNRYIQDDYNNELPDPFILKGKKKSEVMYNNPYLNDVLPLDRSEALKKLASTAKNIKIIDKIKSNRYLIQHPDLYRNKLKVSSDTLDNLLRNRRAQHQSFSPQQRNPDISNSQIKPNLSMTNIEYFKPKTVIDCNSTKDYTQRIKRLYKEFSPKINYRLQKQIDDSENVDFKSNNFNCSKNDQNKVNKLESDINNRQSAYLANLNNFNIRESYVENKKCFFDVPRKKFVIYNPIIDKNEVIQPANFHFPKWTKFHESWEVLHNNLKRKGGYFSEFLNKNKLHFDLRKMEKMKEVELNNQKRKIRIAQKKN